MKVSKSVVIVLIVLVMVQPLLMLVLSLRFGIPTSVQLSVEIGGLMGTIFTAGGFVIALVSLYTLSSVKNVVDESIGDQLTSISARIDERIQTSLQAYNALESARETWTQWTFKDLDRIHGLLAEADAIDPKLRGLNEFGALVWFLAARAAFLKRFAPDGTYGDAPDPNLQGTFALRALRRLENLTNQPDANQAELDFLLAQVYALVGEPVTTVISYIERAKAAAEALPTFDGVTALTLTASCRSDVDGRRILASCGATEVRADKIKLMLAILPAAQGVLPLVAIPIVNVALLQNPPLTPTVLKLRTLADRQSGFAEWEGSVPTPFGILRGGIPPFSERDPQLGSQTNPEMIAIDELVEQVLNRFLIVAPFYYQNYLSMPRVLDRESAK